MTQKDSQIIDRIKDTPRWEDAVCLIDECETPEGKSLAHTIVVKRHHSAEARCDMI